MYWKTAPEGFACIDFKGFHDLGEDLWDWAETEWTDFEPVSFVFYLEGQVFVVRWVNRNVMVSVRQVNTGSPHVL